MNKAAQALGRLARGVPKKLSAAEIERRRQRMSLINERKRKASKAILKAIRVIPKARPYSTEILREL
jgi:hypothetical protein